LKNFLGVIQAVSNSQVGLNVIAELICGYVLPGRPIANVYFKCYGYMAMYQCLLLISDLKLGMDICKCINETYKYFMNNVVFFFTLKVFI